MNARLAAARALAAVTQRGQSLGATLPAQLARVPARDRGLVQELCYGTLRRWPALDSVLGDLLTRPLKSREHEVRALLLIGLYQLFYLKVPDHAALAETVAAARQLHKPWAAGLINAVLRQGQRRRPDLETALAAHPAHPAWLLEALQRDWPGDWQTVLEANNAHPPLTLRVNLTRVSREVMTRRLAEAGFEATPTPFGEAGLTLAGAADVEQLPGFAEGLLSVQDGAAQLAAPLLDPRPGQRILDACAAPGGKSGHLMEYAPGAELTALDVDPGRLARVTDNLARLGLTARVVAGDALEPELWWDGRPFEAILVDAPCSGSGVIRRHPDIKLLRQPADIALLARRQQALLTALWPLLVPGGRLLYATCSSLRAENEGVITAFLEARNDAREAVIEAPWGRAGRHGRQILPGQDGMDGFFYAALVKGS